MSNNTGTVKERYCTDCKYIGYIKGYSYPRGVVDIECCVNPRITKRNLVTGSLGTEFYSIQRKETGDCRVSAIYFEPKQKLSEKIIKYFRGI